jgi:iron(III) transport system ATP-binding protein
MNTLSVRNIHKTFDKSHALRDTSLSISKGEIHSLVGESGSGKTTLMRIIAGLEQADSGEVWIHNTAHTHTSPRKRNIGLVFQDYALFPHMTVEQNINFPMRSQSSGEKKQRIQELLQLMMLPDIRKRYPHELSGGQQQRVAIARALAVQPPLLLLDEPFSNLDPISKKKLRQSVRDLADEFQIAVLIVTHDMHDALLFSNSITILKEGITIQQGDAETLSKNPSSSYVKDLLES